MLLVADDPSYPSLHLTDGGPAQVVGRKQGDLVLPGAKVSKVHCSLWMTGGTAYLQDSSANGTWLDNARVAKDEKLPLSLGSVVSFPVKPGDVNLPKYTLQAAQPSEADAGEEGALENSPATHLAHDSSASAAPDEPVAEPPAAAPAAAAAAAASSAAVTSSAAASCSLDLGDEMPNLSRRSWNSARDEMDSEPMILKRRPLEAPTSAPSDSPPALLARRPLPDNSGGVAAAAAAAEAEAEDPGSDGSEALELDLPPPAPPAAPPPRAAGGGSAPSGGMAALLAYDQLMSQKHGMPPSLTAARRRTCRSS